jgi:hypothetical protein
MCSTFVQGDYVVNLFYPSNQSFFQAFLTQGVFLNVALSNASPFSSIALVTFRGAFVPVVLSMSRAFMLVAVGFVTKHFATWISAGFLWFSWHLLSLLQEKQKALNVWFTSRAFFILFSIISYHTKEHK